MSEPFDEEEMQIVREHLTDSHPESLALRMLATVDALRDELERVKAERDALAEEVEEPSDVDDAWASLGVQTVRAGEAEGKLEAIVACLRTCFLDDGGKKDALKLAQAVEQDLQNERNKFCQTREWAYEERERGDKAIGERDTARQEAAAAQAEVRELRDFVEMAAQWLSTGQGHDRNNGLVTDMRRLLAQTPGSTDALERYKGARMSEGFYEREVGARWDEILELWEAGELDEALEKARALIIDLDARLEAIDGAPE